MMLRLSGARAVLLTSMWVAGGLSAAQAQDVPGKAVFESRCVACHGAAGVGQAGIAPALADALPYLGKPAGQAYVLGVLTHGLSGKIVSKGQTFVAAMPAQTDLSDADLANVVAYLGTLNGADVTIAPAAVAQQRAATTTHKALREQRTALQAP